MRFTILLLIPFAAATVNASAELQIDGTLHSITSDDFVILSSQRYYSVRKSRVSSSQRELLEKHQKGMVSIHVPMGAIDSVKMLAQNTSPETVAKPATRAPRSAPQPKKR